MRYALTGALIVSMLVMLGGAFFLFYPDLKFPWQAPNEEVPTISGAEIMSGVAEFISSSWHPDGSFTYFYECSRDDYTCIPIPDESTITSSIAAYLLRYAEATGLSLYRQRADVAVERMLFECQTEAQMCDRNFYAFLAYYNVTGEQKYLQAMEKAGPLLLEMATNEAAHEDPEYIAQLAYTGIVNELAHLYKYTGTPQYYDVVDTLASTVVEQGFQKLGGRLMYVSYDTEEVGVRTPFLVSNILVPAYQITQKEEYKAPIEKIFLETDLAAQTDALLTTWPPARNMRRIAIGLLSMYNLETNPEKKRAYKDAADRVISLLVSNRIDAFARPIFDGTNTFVTGRTDTSGQPAGAIQSVTYKSLDENAVVANLILIGDYANYDFSLESFGR